MNEQDTIHLKSIASSLKKLVELKESEVMLKRIEVMLHENFWSGLLSSKTAPQKATEEFYKDFEDGI